MRVLSIEPEPFHALPYCVGTEAGRVTAVLPFYRARVDGLPANVDALVATSDLQGVVPGPADPPRLLGEAVAIELDRLRSRGALGPKHRTAALLAGDFYPAADEGDVTGVWLAMAERCRWVAGVAGNHDAFGPNGTSADHARAALDRPNLHFLDEDTATLDGLTIAGLSGITGRGPWSRDPDRFASAIARLAEREPDLLVSHDGPNVVGTNLAGWPVVREVLEASHPTLLVRGHDPWPTPLVTLANGTQVLNVEGRAIVMGR